MLVSYNFKKISPKQFTLKREKESHLIPKRKNTYHSINDINSAHQNVNFQLKSDKKQLKDDFYFNVSIIFRAFQSVFENFLIQTIYFFQLFDCRNHIRVVQSMDNGNRLYICGTNAHNPKDYVIYVSILLGFELIRYWKM